MKSSSGGVTQDRAEIRTPHPLTKQKLNYMNQVIRFRATEEEVQTLKEYAFKNGITLSALIRSKLFKPTLKRKSEPIQRSAA
ncbi:MAG: hypothetical protein ACK5XN_15185, partial [Bacteroidota bacterium]